jgi:hypothetical protein
MPGADKLVGKNAVLKRECNDQGFIHLEFDDREEGVGFVVREKGASYAALGSGDSFAESIVVPYFQSAGPIAMYRA